MEERSKKNWFWNWYERYYTVNISIAAFLFVWQLIHLYWLTADVVLARLVGSSFWEVSALGRILIILVDYTEIPALVASSLVYWHDLREKFTWKSVIFLVLLNSQWLHLFWITDEFVVERFAGKGSTILPLWLAWVAILIDYLELPVIYDTIRRAARALMKV